MRRRVANNSRTRLIAIFAVTAAFGAFPSCAEAWGRNAHRLIINKAVDALPSDVRPFFETSRGSILQHVTDPLDALAKNPVEKRNGFIALDKYGRFPFEALPRSYKSAVTKFGKLKLETNGLLPWQIGVYSEKLTNAMKAGKWDEARLDAAILAHYIAQAHDPFNTTDNSDGHLSGQTGINERFGSALIDRYSSFFPMRPNDAAFISDPTDHAFDACLRAHRWLETILLADRDALRGQNSYTDEYYDRFYNEAGAILIRQLSDAATDVGSFWLTAWTNAGRPALPSH
ncbi:MAG TPA: hypothetical protein VJN89_15050 [Candidatus Acidoferrum sp.]|nr:hypothetical protein [Candidatus Acidoferrum sp.]